MVEENEKVFEIKSIKFTLLSVLRCKLITKIVVDFVRAKPKTLSSSGHSSLNNLFCTSKEVCLLISKVKATYADEHTKNKFYFVFNKDQISAVKQLDGKQNPLPVHLSASISLQKYVEELKKDIDKVSYFASTCWGESFNNLISTLVPKRKYFTASYESKVHLAAMYWNEQRLNVSKEILGELNFELMESTMKHLGQMDAKKGEKRLRKFESKPK